MVKPNKFSRLFKPSKNISKKTAGQGDAGFDNPRENVDPHIKTKVVSTKEIKFEDGASAGFVKNAADGTLTGGNTIDSSDVDLSSITQDVVAAVDDEYDLGSSAKKWGYLYAVIAIVTSIVIGGVIGLSEIDGVLLINASTYVDGNLEVNGNILADNVFNPIAFMFIHTNDTIPIVAAGVWHNVTFTESTNGISQNIDHTPDDETNTTFTILHSGIYDLHAHLTFQDSAALPDSNIAFRFTRNETEIFGSLREKDLDKKDADSTASTTVFANLTAGDRVMLQFVSDDITVSLDSDFTFGEHKDTAVIKIKRIG